MLTLEEALYRYRKKDSVEKIIKFMINEIKVISVRCWKKGRQIDFLLIGFLAQLFISFL